MKNAVVTLSIYTLWVVVPIVGALLGAVQLIAHRIRRG